MFRDFRLCENLAVRALIGCSIAINPVSEEIPDRDQGAPIQFPGSMMRI